MEGDSFAEGLEGEGVVVEVVEGNMLVGKMVEDYMGKVAGIRGDSMVEAFEDFVVDSFDFVELGWIVRC